MKPAPLVLIIGFLGAGKTTLLRELLPLLESRGLNPFVIINDYANARVDASSLVKKGRTVTPINGNCICCDSVIELMNVLLEIPLTENRVVLIEANGTTDPTALIEHLLVNPELRRRFAPVLQVGVVDLKRWQKRHWHNELERLQVETASHLLFTRDDEVPKKRSAQVRADIEWFHHKAAPIRARSFADELEKLVKTSALHAAQHSHPCRQCNTEHLEHDHHHEHEHHHEHHHEHEHEHEHDRHGLSHAFVGVQIELPAIMQSADLQRWLRSLPPEVLRVKGVVQLAEQPGRWHQFQRIDELRGEAALFELPQNPAVPACAVLIGVKLDESAIRRALREVIGKEIPHAA